MQSIEPSKIQMLWIEYRMWIYIVVFGGGFLLAGNIIANGFINVPEGKAMVLIRKTGINLPSGQIIATKPGVKGIQLKLYPEGWHFLNPYVWEAQIIQKIEIPEGKLGVVTRLYGTSLPRGQIIAGKGQKGILRDVLRPGRHTINPYAYQVYLYNKKSVPPGYLGVVIQLSGKAPKNPNVFITRAEERGVQRQTLDVGDYYINPFIRRIVPVDVRAHKSELSGKIGGIAFPSKDGFQITMDATIEWYIARKRVSEVFVKYVDNQNSVIRNVIGKIILPFARAFSRLEGSNYLAREFIGGQTRQRFQEAFLQGMQKACATQGIIIRSALIKNVVPPVAIVTPIKKREITIRKRDKYTQQMAREKQQKKLAIEQTLQLRAKQIKQAQADVSVALTRAAQQKEVALIHAQKKLQYAKLRLLAARNEVAIILAKGRAKAQVITLKNKALAEGLRHSVRAFGSGDAFVKYLYYKRLAGSFKQILSNTNGPFLEVFKTLSKNTIPMRKKEAHKATRVPTQKKGGQ